MYMYMFFYPFTVSTGHSFFLQTFVSSNLNNQDLSAIIEEGVFSQSCEESAGTVCTGGDMKGDKRGFSMFNY